MSRRWTVMVVALAAGWATTAGTAAALPIVDDATSSTTSVVAAKAKPKPPLIVIDPGHSGKSIRSTTTHGLRDIDYPNYPELYEMWDVSVCVGRALRTDGYRVTLTKKKATSSVSHTARAKIANDGAAALAVSVHDDHGQGPSFQATYSQRGVKHRGKYHTMYRGKGSHRTVFNRPAVARRSESYARTIAAARSKAQGRKVSVRENSFNGRAPLEPGNLALVQLLSHVPWVYNEVGAKTAGSTTRAMSINAEVGYAKGLLAGIEASVPIKDRRSPSAKATAGVRGCLVEQIGTEGHYSRPPRYLPYGWKA